MAVRQRTQASDFNAALYEHTQRVQRAKKAAQLREQYEGTDEEGQLRGALQDYSLRPGETITLSIPKVCMSTLSRLPSRMSEPGGQSQLPLRILEPALFGHGHVAVMHLRRDAAPIRTQRNLDRSGAGRVLQDAFSPDRRVAPMLCSQTPNKSSESIQMSSEAPGLSSAGTPKLSMYSPALESPGVARKLSPTFQKHLVTLTTTAGVRSCFPSRQCLLTLTSHGKRFENISTYVAWLDGTCRRCCSFPPFSASSPPTTTTTIVCTKLTRSTSVLRKGSGMCRLYLFPLLPGVGGWVAFEEWTGLMDVDHRET